jgi:2,4-dienoyl-CoA reductase-like NADH-dependent reductase (Old Yellow Enzyme family)
MSLDLLWEPIRLGAVEVPNRIFVSAHTTNFADRNRPTERHVAYHRERAEGGAGLIITEAVRVHPTSAGRASSLAAFSDDDVPAFAALVDAVHDGGARIFAQLAHLGRQASGDANRECAWAASPLPWSLGSHNPHEMTAAEINAVVDSFAVTAVRMVNAGFDGIELHLGHGHLLQQFLSPATNHRRDAYGGSDAARLRLSREVLAAVLGWVPDALPVGIRVSADEFLAGGLHVSDMLDVVNALRAEFPLAYVHVSHSAYVGDYSLSTQIADMSFPSAPFRQFPAAFKRAFPSLPVLAICRLDDAATAASILAAGEADLVGLTRAHIADPHLVRKVREGRADEVRSCIACNQGCIARIEKNLPMSCIVNPEVGFEREWRAWRTAAPSSDGRILVVGGGPAGLQASVTARRLGSQVDLVEAADHLGGTVRHAATLKNRERLGLLTEELARDAERLGVRIRISTPMTPAELSAGDWTAVIIATGSVPRVDEVPGMTTLSVLDAIERPDEVGDQPVVFDEIGNWAAAAVTEHLARSDRQIVLLTPVAGVAWNVTTYSRLALLDRLGRLPVDIQPLRRPVRGTSDGLVVADVVSGRERVLPGVTAVVHVGPPVARDQLFREVHAEPGKPPMRLVGDAYAPRSALEAVFDGRLATAQLLTGGPNLAGCVP